MRKTFMISDLHLGHFNIIKYSGRPFQSLEEMDETLINNWNDVISQNDTVFFLGDLSFGRNTCTDDWLHALNGKIIYFRGNHDRSNKITFIDSAVVTFEDISFFLIHDPGDVPSCWDSWVIHGHHHNNYPDIYPRINYEKRTINVCVEWWDYTPISIETILELVQKKVINKWNKNL